MRNYLGLLQDILVNGEDREDRTGVGTRSVFGRSLRFDLAQGFPLLTTKKMFFRGVIEELLWMLKGHTKIDYLREKDVHIWDEWATEAQCARFGRKAGELGPIYGHQWRNFGATKRGPNLWADDGFDQIGAVLELLRRHPASRRIILSGWHPGEALQVALPPCHTLVQFYVSGLHADRHQMRPKLCAHLYQRSADVFLGVPFNIASYALLTHILAAFSGLGVGEFVHTFGDVHIYKNHFEAVCTQLNREPLELPDLTIVNYAELTDPSQLQYPQNFLIRRYQYWPPIKAPVAV